MKKDEKDCFCKEPFTGFEKQVKTKIEDVQKYAKKNPQKTKTAIVGLGAFLMVVLGFFIGKDKD